MRGAQLVAGDSPQDRDSAQLARLAENLAHQFGCVLRIEFFQQIGSVKFDGARADVERASHLFAGMPPDDFSQDHTLPRSQMLMQFGILRGLGLGNLQHRPSARLAQLGKHFRIEETSLWPSGHCSDKSCSRMEEENSAA